MENTNTNNKQVESVITIKRTFRYGSMFMVIKINSDVFAWYDFDNDDYEIQSSCTPLLWIDVHNVNKECFWKFMEILLVSNYKNWRYVNEK